MCDREDSSMESHLKWKIAEAVPADYTGFLVCLKGILICIFNCFVTIGDMDMPLCYGVDVFLSWRYLFWQQTPEFFQCTAEEINCSTEIRANIPMLSIAVLG